MRFYLTSAFDPPCVSPFQLLDLASGSQPSCRHISTIERSCSEYDSGDRICINDVLHLKRSQNVKMSS
jgi:hypothetical protein